MTLLITIFAAVICTVIWYRKAPQDTMMVRVLCFLYWGASLMWFVDAVFEYKELGAAYFTPTLTDMANDAFLGLSVIALGLVIWLIVLLIKDPKHVIRDILFKKKK